MWIWHPTKESATTNVQDGKKNPQGFAVPKAILQNDFGIIFAPTWKI